MTHPSVEDVALHLEGVLDPADEQRVRTHLGQCAACAATAQDLRAVTEHLHATAQSSQSSLPIPADVAARVDSALAQQAHDRAAVTHTDPEEVPAEAASGMVGDLAERRRRRRRVLSAGVLAAAAATVVAVGLGQLMQTGGSGQASQAAGGSAHTLTAERQQAQRGDAGHGPEASVLGADGPGGVDATGKPPGQELGGPHVDGFQALAAQRADLGLIDGVAAAHSPDRAQHDLPGCVRAALGDDPGPVASYAVRLPTRAGASGVVVLRPNTAPTEGVLIACSPQPHVLARRGLHP